MARKMLVNSVQRKSALKRVHVAQMDGQTLHNKKGLAISSCVATESVARYNSHGISGVKLLSFEPESCSFLQAQTFECRGPCERKSFFLHSVVLISC